MDKFYVYILFRPWNCEPCYVGKGYGSRADYHAMLGSGHYNRHLAAIFKKAGAQGVPCVLFHEGLDEKIAFEYEIALIAAIGRSDLGLGPLCNLTDGGEGISGAVLFYDPARKAKVSETHTGKVVSAETRAKQRARRLGQKDSEETKTRKRSAQLGSKHTSESNAKISKRFKGKPLSAEHCLKVSKALTGRKLSPAHVANIKAGLQRRRLPPAD